MATTADLLADGFGRVKENVHAVVHGLTPEQLSIRLDPDANSVAWLIWHLTRVQDDHVAGIMQSGQVWITGGWADRFALPLDRMSIGYGHTPEQAGAVRVSSGDLLTGYYDAVHEQTIRFVSRLTDSDLDRIVDPRWDPPVTMAVRLISVIDDDAQHVGQAAFVRGIIERS